MTTSITFVDYNSQGFLTKQEVRDLIDVLYRGGGMFMHIHSQMAEGKSKSFRGLHSWNPLFEQHDIYLAPDRIAESFYQGQPIGGNRRSPDLYVAYGMVLAHELQHANQAMVHGNHPDSFYGKRNSKYRSRPCEREARQFADDNMYLIADVLGVKLEKNIVVEPPADELLLVAQCLAECEELTTKDIVEELRLSGLNNAVNVQKVKNFISGFTP